MIQHSESLNNLSGPSFGLDVTQQSVEGGLDNVAATGNRQLRDRILFAARSERQRCLANVGLAPPSAPITTQAVQTEIIVLERASQTDSVTVVESRKADWSSSDEDSQAEALRMLKQMADRGPGGKTAMSLEARVAQLEGQLGQERQRTEAAQRQVLCLEAELDKSEAALASTEHHLQRRELELKVARQQLGQSEPFSTLVSPSNLRVASPSKATPQKLTFALPPEVNSPIPRQSSPKRAMTPQRVVTPQKGTPGLRPASTMASRPSPNHLDQSLLVESAKLLAQALAQQEPPVAAVSEQQRHRLLDLNNTEVLQQAALLQVLLQQRGRLTAGIGESTTDCSSDVGSQSLYSMSSCGSRGSRGSLN